MKINQTITEDAVTGAVLMLQRHVPEISPKTLISALRNYDTAPRVEQVEKPFTKKEAAEMLRVSMPTIDRYIAAGLLKKVKLGTQTVRIAAASVRALLSGESE